MLTFDDLAVPRPQSATARRLFGEYLRFITRRLLGLRRVGHELDAAIEFVEGQLGEKPGLVLSVLRRPNVSALVRLIEPGADPAWQRELATLLWLELALCGEVPPREVALKCPAVLCALGAQRAYATPGKLVIGPAGVRSSCTAIDAYHPIAEGLVLATRDNNPLSTHEAHPDKQGNRVNLGDQPVERWVAAFRAALGIVRQHFPEIADEMAIGVSQIVPVGTRIDRHESASYAEAVGTIYASLHPDPLVLAEALIHEHSHGKLNALAALTPLLADTAGAFESPLRPDPRPLGGVLLAAHALVPMAELHRRLRAAQDPRALTAGAVRRGDGLATQARDATRTLLDHAHPSAPGQALLEELRRWCESC